MCSAVSKRSISIHVLDSLVTYLKRVFLQSLSEIKCLFFITNNYFQAGTVFFFLRLPLFSHLLQVYFSKRDFFRFIFLSSLQIHFDLTLKENSRKIVNKVLVIKSLK